MRNLSALICVLVMSSSAIAKASPAHSPIFDVPRLSGIVIDGNPSDWGNEGFRVEALAGVDGRLCPAADLAASFRLGWDSSGLLVMVRVSDDISIEYPDDTQLWRNDSVELFAASKRGSPEHYQMVIGPGADPKHPDLRSATYDHRRSQDTLPKLTSVAARTRTGDGYVLEALLPWRNLAVTPRFGDEIGFQLYVNDSDDLGERYKAVWYPRDQAHEDSYSMHRLRLSRTPSPSVLVAAGGGYQGFRRTRIGLQAVGELAGKSVEVRDGQATLGSGVLAQDGARASAELILPMPPTGRSYGELTVYVDGGPAATVPLPDAGEQRARALMDVKFHLVPTVFSGNAFPTCQLESPSLVEDLVGPYSLKTTYYDSNGRVVTSAEKPGRYGAVVEIHPEGGHAVRRFRTLFRQVGGEAPEQEGVEPSLSLLRIMGADPQVAAEQWPVVGDFAKTRFLDLALRDDASGALLSGLGEMVPGSGEAGPADDVWARDRQYWVKVKRELYGTAALFPRPFVCPEIVEGDPSPVLRAGTLSEAGMNPDAADRIDAVCRNWAADSDEGFAVCVARHGVVVLHKAYGMRDGKPMTVGDKSWMASITKLLSGTLMMMVVDKGLVGLEDPVDRYLPAFQGIQVATPLTIRHLYTHTNGLWGHWGDDLNDFEEQIADYYPYLKVGESHSYNGAGYAVGGKVMEAVTGEAVPQLYKSHLLGPLGCTNTRVTDTSAGARSTPLDIAKIGQMLLNRGRYGDKRFFTEETFKAMLPQRLTKLLGPETSIEWGIGVTWYYEKGLGKGTFGHGAASAATLRIDPADDLVIVMTRNAAGANFGKYHPQFIQAVAEGILRR